MFFRMKHIIKKDLEILKEKLIEEKTRLESSLSVLGRQLVDGDWITVIKENNGDTLPEDVADRVEDMYTRSGTLTELERKYVEVTDALNKMESEGYGICEISKKPIEVKRLMINPSARTAAAHMNDQVWEDFDAELLDEDSESQNHENTPEEE
jgi:RNA polymerase-binding transcription factor DksA